ncbi:MAG: hypothetical protein A2V88_12250 [Elusimicrobia bacterium RBG_16_66_12]|nr:MAG: hypothetical protein A2V88_12250 [Elusimicrobia bacterium RBG_16_66_12]
MQVIVNLKYDTLGPIIAAELLFILPPYEWESIHYVLDSVARRRKHLCEVIGLTPPLVFGAEV